MVNKKKSVLFFGIILLVFSLIFVFAALDAPAGLFFNENTTTNYDKEGSFAINWTPVTNAESYTIFIYTDDSLYIAEVNNSASGYSFSNSIEANYTFTIQAENSTGATEYINSTNLSMIVDTTNPAIAYGGSVEVEAANLSQDYIYVNVTASDTYKDTLSFSLYNTTGLVNQTNFTDSYATLTINWTVSGDGTYYYNVTANDSATNSNSTTTRIIILDTTNPSVSSFSCTPSSGVQGFSISCSCSGTDATSSVETTSYTASPSTTAVGSFTETCTVTDYAGNSVSDTTSYTVSSGSSGSSSGNTWGQTFIPSGNQFQNGYTQKLKVNERVRLSINNETHYVGVEGVSENFVDLIIESDPIELTLGVGEDEKVDVEGDGFYDLYIYINSLSSEEVDIILLSISEEIPEGESGLGGIDGEDGEELEKERNLSWLWIVLGVIGMLVVAYLIYSFIRKLKK